MPDFRIRETGEVVSDSEFRLRHKHTSFPRIIDEPLQEEFGIDIPDEDAEKMTNVTDAVKYLEEHSKA